eukprot:TRINITY_DN4529_c0_g1_i1.p1 TRINITY_DN4529_c0_g1~~TRINITY_DN4529_c0_g1_i1.p1  ORF type:complete len:447 (+),score=107.19 TRINITY_DN4529_c0_g1_i1:31-1341(+)
MHSSKGKDLANRPVVVIIGGGYGGVTVAQELDSEANVVLIERKTMFYHNVGALRASVEGNAAPILIPYDNILKFGHVVHAEVTGINVEDRTVQLHGFLTPVSYDYLVIATGTSYAFPMKIASPQASEVARFVQKFATDVKRASQILIAGGGPVGCELAGEIRHIHPNKQITIVHSGMGLIPGPTPPAFKAEIKKRLEAQRVTVLLGDRLEIPEEAREDPSRRTDPDGEEEPSPGLRYVLGKRTYTTRSGTKIKADMLVFATGAQVNSNSYKHEAAIQVTKSKRIIVDEFLRAKGHPKVYALGDCADIEDQLAYLAAFQGKAVAGNILAAMNGRELKPYKKSSKTVMMVPLGPTDGVSAFGTHVIGKTVTRAFKGKNLFIDKYRAQLGMKGTATDVNTQPEIDLVRLASRLHITESEAKELAYQAWPVKYGPEATHA